MDEASCLSYAPKRLLAMHTYMLRSLHELILRWKVSGSQLGPVRQAAKCGMILFMSKSVTKTKPVVEGRRDKRDTNETQVIVQGLYQGRTANSARSIS